MKLSLALKSILGYDYTDESGIVHHSHQIIINASWPAPATSCHCKIMEHNE